MNAFPFWRVVPDTLWVACTATLMSAATFTVATAQDEFSPELKPYVAFLDQQTLSAKDYVLGLFNDYDIVILCERDHREMTQYDLILSIIGDPQFVDSVGNVFTEVGISTQADQINAFLHAEKLAADSVGRLLVHFQRNCTFYSIWEKTNYSTFLRGVFELNQSLPVEKKVNLFNSDLPFDWNTIDDTTLAEFWINLNDVRDSVIASQITSRFDDIRQSTSPRRKALVIMNYRHAFRHDTKNPSGVVRRNVTRFLFDRYGDKTANVLVNQLALVSARSDRDVTYSPIQDGKWDAAFSARNVLDRGFNFNGSPFGDDMFDLWPSNVDWTWKDEFTGLAYYLPFRKHRLATGIPGLVDSTFGIELMRRSALWSRVPGSPFRPITDLEHYRNELNTIHEDRMSNLDSLDAHISKWLQR